MKRGKENKEAVQGRSLGRMKKDSLRGIPEGRTLRDTRTPEKEQRLRKKKEKERGREFEREFQRLCSDREKQRLQKKGRRGLFPLHLTTQSGGVDLLAEFLLDHPSVIEDVARKSVSPPPSEPNYQRWHLL